jgi:hypothetical protein
MTKIAGSGSESGSVSQRHGSADPDPYGSLVVCWVPLASLLAHPGPTRYTAPYRQTKEEKERNRGEKEKGDRDILKHTFPELKKACSY